MRRSSAPTCASRGGWLVSFKRGMECLRPDGRGDQLDQGADAVAGAAGEEAQATSLPGAARARRACRESPDSFYGEIERQTRPVGSRLSALMRLRQQARRRRGRARRRSRALALGIRVHGPNFTRPFDVARVHDAYAPERAPQDSAALAVEVAVFGNIGLMS